MVSHPRRNISRYIFRSNRQLDKKSEIPNEKSKQKRDKNKSSSHNSSKPQTTIKSIILTQHLKQIKEHIQKWWHNYFQLKDH